MEMKKKRKALPFVMILALLCAAFGGALLVTQMIYAGVIIPNQLYITDKDIVGCDVSRYQGEIQWDVLSQQDIAFAYIKATEGSSYVDPNFEENWEQAFQTDLLVGAYHFFSFESPGDNQASHFVQTVPPKSNMLPPVADIEFYGNYNEQNTNASEIREELNAFLLATEKFYGAKPMIYTTPEAYDHFIKGYFEEYPLWIRSILTKPAIDREWSFWQYTNRKRLRGYSGPEKYIDMNVFHGDESMLRELLIK